MQALLAGEDGKGRVKGGWLVCRTRNYAALLPCCTLGRWMQLSGQPP